MAKGEEADDAVVVNFISGSKEIVLTHLHGNGPACLSCK